MKRHAIATVALSLATLCATQARAADLKCKLHFNLSSWSVLYKHAAGTGTINCTDGQSMKVKITANGGGISVGKAKVKDGVGNFTGLANLADATGTYAQGDASFGMFKNGDAQILTKGPLTLTIAGAGRGFGMGVSVGAFKIERAN
jgi:hypothetical protein